MSRHHDAHRSGRRGGEEEHSHQRCTQPHVTTWSPSTGAENGIFLPASLGDGWGHPQPPGWERVASAVGIDPGRKPTATAGEW